MEIRESRFPVVTTVLLLVLSLVVLGVGYGLWSKNLRIHGTIETGNVDAKWIFAGCFEFYPWPGGGNYGEYEDKDVGSWKTIIDPIDDQILHFTIENGYPSYAVDCEVHFENDGSIPVKIRGTHIIPISTNLTNCTLTGNKTKTLECDQITVIFFDGIGSQIDPHDMAASSLMVHVEQPAEPETTYEFDVMVCMAQWNEDATAEECFAAAP